MAFIEVKNLCCSYTSGEKKTAVLRGVNFSLPRRGSVAILGESGSGKSTLLHALAGYIDYTGEIKTSGATFSFVFQDSYMVPFLDLVSNTALPLAFSGVGRKERRKRAATALKKLGLRDLSKNPSELSGGERERVGIARALVQDAEVILMDEPTGSLDQANAAMVAAVIGDLKRERLVVFATHDEDLAKKAANIILEIKGGTVRGSLPVEEVKPVVCPKKHGHLKGSDAFGLSYLMLLSKAGKIALSLFVLSLCLAFAVLITDVFLNSPEALAGFGDRYYGRSFTSVSLVERTSVDGGFDLVKSVRPTREEIESKGFEVLPDLSGILGSTIAFRAESRLEESVLEPSVCDSSLLKSGRCPAAASEVVINDTLSKRLSGGELKRLTKTFDIVTRGNGRTALDRISLEFGFSVVGIAAEPNVFNIPGCYYDYDLLSAYLKGIVLKNASLLLDRDVSLYARIELASGDEYVSGYGYLVLGDPKAVAASFSSPYETENRALEMEKSVQTLISSLALAAQLFMVLALGSSVMLEFLVLLSVYEDNLSVLALCHSLGGRRRDLLSIARQAGAIMAGLTTVLTAVIASSVGTILRSRLKTYELAEFLSAEPPFLLFLPVLAFCLISALLASWLSMRKVLGGNLIDRLKGE